ncbi:hypothetical protein SAMN05444266_101750 [Chitinophaga jiangningensis]|uniref:Uncharacterized protein n=1 Tax=Chitinophaga jiangningensis TaxID=1419482 RepID=A0A1M6WSQ5_9BACT|nr:hypothetical protein SAMN05444266_101750 [Chitinophaga jiangningensis]
MLNLYSINSACHRKMAGFFIPQSDKTLIPILFID